MEEFVFTRSDEATPSGSALRWPRRCRRGRRWRSSARWAPARRGWCRRLPRRCGVPRDAATSPTFVLVNEYRGRVPIYHIDAYRLRDEDEFLELGPEEYFESEGVTFVEWADRVADCLPAERLEIRCEAVGETERRFTIPRCGVAA